MDNRFSNLNERFKLVLYVLFAISLVATIPYLANRTKLESSAKQVEFIFDYRGLTEIAYYQSKPEKYLDEQLAALKAAGVKSMAIYESTLKDLQLLKRINYYSTEELEKAQKIDSTSSENFTYIIYSDDDARIEMDSFIREAFSNVSIREWTFNGKQGIVIEAALAEAIMKPIGFDPITLNKLSSDGFEIIPRFSDRSLPYDHEKVKQQMEVFEQLGVTHILFDGDSVKGFTDQEDLKSLDLFGNLLNQHHIGIISIENLLPQSQNGFNYLAKITNFNVVRLYSLSGIDATRLTADTIVDRFLLAAKDRNIRMFYLNAAIFNNPGKAGLVSSLDNLLIAFDDQVGIIPTLEKQGFPTGEAEAFQVNKNSWENPLKVLIILGALSLITLCISSFFMLLTIPSFIIGIISSIGLFFYNIDILMQALALGVGVSTPTLAIISVLKMILRKQTTPVNHKKNLLAALKLLVITTVITLSGVPFIVSLLNNVSYMLSINQFRGVSVLHLAPIALVTLYILLFIDKSPIKRLRYILIQPIKVWWVIAVVVIGIVGFYYISRTGNSGEAPAIEIFIRKILENSIGVRPRFKEFMFAHPLFLFGLFLVLRYRLAIPFLIIGSVGQLSLVDTFAHIHTPLYISTIRVFLGLGLGVLIGLILILVYVFIENLFRKYIMNRV
ncbi:DUF5693 family protein [Paenibacillus amylolyticus]|uniref:DUF5693 family protein n=1 Tax=Paenibacillus amylolyticus TaxID=1451 RepID=UPI003D97BC41